MGEIFQLIILRGGLVLLFCYCLLRSQQPNQNSFLSMIRSLTFTDTAMQIISNTISRQAVCHPEILPRNSKLLTKPFFYILYPSLHTATSKKSAAAAATMMILLFSASYFNRSGIIPQRIIPARIIETPALIRRSCIS